MNLTKNLRLDECKQVWEQTKVHADETHQTDPAYPVRSDST